MSMLGLQTVVARLCVDMKFRQAFIASPDAALAGCDLSAAEAESLKAIDMQAVREYAGALVAKRVGLIKKWFPLTLSWLETNLTPHEFQHLLQRYGIEQIRDTDDLGGEWVRSESTRFADYLRTLIAQEELRVPHCSAILEFEAFQFAMQLDSQVSVSAVAFAQANAGKEFPLDAAELATVRPLLGAHARMRLFDYDISELMSSLEAGELPPDPPAEPTWVLFFKKAHAVKVDSSAINAPLKDLLDLCAGQLSVAEIISAIAIKHAAALEVSEAELTEDCLGILAQLYGYGAITFAGAPCTTCCHEHDHEHTHEHVHEHAPATEAPAAH